MYFDINSNSHFQNKTKLSYSNKNQAKTIRGRDITCDGELRDIRVWLLSSASSALDSLRSWHVSIFGHVLWSQWIQCHRIPDRSHAQNINGYVSWSQRIQCHKTLDKSQTQNITSKCINTKYSYKNKNITVSTASLTPVLIYCSFWDIHRKW